LQIAAEPGIVLELVPPSDLEKHCAFMRADATGK